MTWGIEARFSEGRGVDVLGPLFEISHQLIGRAYEAKNVASTRLEAFLYYSLIRSKLS